MSDLPTTIAPGDPDHIPHHEEMHAFLERLSEAGVTDFTATGIGRGLLADRPAAADGEDLFWWATDTPRLSYSDGSSWHDMILASTSNDFTALQSFDEDVFFKSGKPWVSVQHEDFGATGDGITNDRAAIQLAVDYAVDTLGGNCIVWFDAGTYYIQGNSNNGVQKAGAVNLTLAGPGAKAATVKKDPANNARWFRFDDFTNLTVVNLGFDYNGGGQFGGFSFNSLTANGSASGLRVFHCQAFDSNPQAWVSGATPDRYFLVINSAFTVNDIEVAFCEIADIGTEWDNVDGVRIHHNVFRDTKSTAPAGSFKVGAVNPKLLRDFRFEFNEVIDWGTNGVVIRNESSGIEDFTVDGVTIRGNRFLSKTVEPRYAIAVGSFHGNAAAAGNIFRGIVVVDNEIIITAAITGENRIVYIKHDQPGLTFDQLRVERNTVRLFTPNAVSTAAVIDVREGGEGTVIGDNSVKAVCPRHYNSGSEGWVRDNFSDGATDVPFAIGGPTVMVRGNEIVNGPATHYSGLGTGDWVFDNRDTQQIAASAVVVAWAASMRVPAGSSITVINGGFTGARLLLTWDAGRTLFHNGDVTGTSGAAGAVRTKSGAAIAGAVGASTRTTILLEKQSDGYWYEI